MDYCPTLRTIGALADSVRTVRTAPDILLTMPELPKFVPLEYIMDELSISRSQAYALVRTGDLRAIQVGGRGQWRISLDELEAYIERAYAETDQRLP